MRPRTPTIGVYQPFFGRRESTLVSQALRGGWISSHGPFVHRFERAFSRYIGAPHGVTTSTGTAALHLGLAALRVGPGDEVILPDCTMVACLDAVLYTGATPVFVDVDPATWTLDPSLAESAITPRTRAIMPVHIYGHPVEMDRLLAIARRHRTAVIEDAAEAHGSEFRGQRVGALGDLGCFSFYATKILATGEGGMIVTRRADLAERARLLRDLAFASASRDYRHVEVGFNYRLTDLQSAVGLAQLSRVTAFIRLRRRCAAAYREELEGMGGLTLPVEAPWARSAYWAYTVLVHGGISRRQRLARYLARCKIETRAAFWPLHRQPFAPRPGRRSVGFPVSDRIGEEGLTLPMGNGIPLPMVRRVAQAVRDGLRRIP
jgi:perosamine synthetase